MKKIALGTAQFGMDYGINNQRGKVPQEEVFAILGRAVEYGIDTLDTAYAYGESERVLGEFIQTNKCSLKIISKLPKCALPEVEGMFLSSLNKLNLDSLYGYLIHSFESYKDSPQIWEKLEQLKKSGKVKKIGFSLYFPDELEYIWKNNLKIDMLQVPYNLFDRRFEPYFSRLKDNGTLVYARSVFLQGLVFKKPEELNANFSEARDKFIRLNSLAKESGIPVSVLCMGFTAKNNFVDKIVVGIDSQRHFNEIIQAVGQLSRVDSVFDVLSGLRIDDERVILPINWDKDKVMAQ
jgi:aryl-alcohol dehydrogenase-like predicted oxidoreductase